MKTKRKTTRNKNNDYIDSKKFTQAIIRYVDDVKMARKAEEEIPIVPDNIAIDILKLCEGLSLRPNFIGYTYREDMVMDAVENCLRAIESYDPNYVSKAGYKINAFNYFTTCAYYAMVRRIQKENKDVDLKNKIIEKSVISEFIDDDGESSGRHYVDQLRNFNLKEWE